MVAPQQDTRGRERLLAAARTLFANNGFHQTSMAHLAAAANVSVGLIYRSFRSKEDIIQAIVEADMVEDIGDIREIHRRCTAKEISVEQAFQELFAHVRHKEDEALSFEILAEGFRNDKVRDVIGGCCDDIRSLLREFARMANPALSEHSLDGVEDFMLACLFGLNHFSLSRPNLDEADTSRQAATMTLIALRGLK